MYQPQLVEVDPQRIKFSAMNPRKHGGEEFERLKQSIQEIGIVQMPIVRVLSGGFYEVIDGEGRVRAAQETHLSKIWVVSLGIVNDQEALTMLQASNSVREFSFIAECRGMANMHRQGMTYENLAKKVGLTPPVASHLIAIGYFPNDLLEIMMGAGLSDSDKPRLSWGHRTVREFLPLRQVIPGKSMPNNGSSLDGVYDYTEVRKAIEKAIHGELSTQAEIHAYVEQRRRELFEQRFNQELQARLQGELIQAKQALEEANQQQLQDIEKKTKERYAAQVAILQEQLKDTEERYNKIVKEVAKKPDEKKLIEQREKELREQVQKTESARQELQRQQLQMQTEMQEELKRTQQRTLEELRQKINADLQEQRKAMQEEHKRAEADLKAYYAQRDQERQLKAEESVRQMSAHGVELLAQTQQWILHITSPGMINGLEWLGQAEIVSLLAQMRAVRDILETAEETLRHGEGVPPNGNVIDQTSGGKGLTRV